jgi:prepilin signal peptidase PulO-like enzyme (type II secretory pathway)
LSLPAPVRLVALAVLGALLGAMVNWIVDRVRWVPTYYSPWSRHPSAAWRRGRADYIPIWGWVARRRESKHLGAWFWMRPLAVEVLLALGLPALYWHQVVRQALAPGWTGPAESVALPLHAAFSAHVALLVLMLIASLVDLDEKLIPDAVTVPGTLIALGLAALVPASLLPEVAGRSFRIVTLASPNAWPAGLEGAPRLGGLALGLGCVWLWCAGLAPRVWRPQRGWRVALGLFLGRLRDRVTIYIAAMGAVVSLGVAAAWWRGGLGWRALLTALVGMAATGGFTWLVRIVAGRSIGREALGFGDVTLMAMIGAFLGWQAGLMVFFLGPFFGLVSGLAQWVFHRDPEIPYGPFLCLAALTVVLRWPDFWAFGRELFVLGWIIPATLLVTVVLMGLMLSVWHWILGR